METHPGTCLWEPGGKIPFPFPTLVFLERLPSPTLDLLKGNNKSLVHKFLAYKHDPVAEKRVHFVL